MNSVSLKKAPELTMNFDTKAIKEISASMNTVLADVYALYLKTKNFHWHVSGLHFRDYHLMFDEFAGELLAMTDAIAERVRKVGGTTLRSIGQIKKLQTITDNEKDAVSSINMLVELHNDNQLLLKNLRAAHEIADKHGDFGTTSVIENWIDETERRIWFLLETSQQ